MSTRGSGLSYNPANTGISCNSPIIGERPRVSTCMLSKPDIEKTTSIPGSAITEAMVTFLNLNKATTGPVEPGLHTIVPEPLTISLEEYTGSVDCSVNVIVHLRHI